MMKKIALLFSIFFCTSLFAQEEKLVLDENFNNNTNGWYVGSDEYHLAELDTINGIYHLKNDSANPNSINKNISNVDLNDVNFTIETKIMHVSGIKNRGYGLRFGSNTNYAVIFYVTENGFFQFYEYYSKEWHKKMEWKETKLLNPSGQYNTLKVKRTAHMMQFYINDELVYNFYEKMYYGTNLGFVLPNDKSLELKVDYVKIWTSPIEIPTVENPLEDVKFENLGPNINGEYSEVAPVISADGNEIYFIRKEILDGNKETTDQIYSSKKDENGEWQKAMKAPFPLNIKSHTGVLTLSTDKNELVLYGNRDEKGDFLRSGGICFSQKTIDGWSLPQNTEVVDFVNTSGYREFCVSSSGKELLLSIENTESIGERDIYVSFLEDGKWTKPQNLGVQVNTMGKETSPFLAADNKTLYFSSEGHPGYGKSDVYVTKRLDDTWTNWSKPLNLGKGINSTGGEDFFTLTADGEYGFISLWRDAGNGKSDIYKVKLSESAKPDPLVLIKGKVLNKKTNEPISTAIKYFKLGENKEIGKALSEPETGLYQVSLPKGKKYAYYAEKEGFYAVQDNLDLTNLESYQEIERNLYLAPIEKNEAIRLNNIFFETAKADLKKESFPELNKLLNLLISNSDIVIEIRGHTDNVGSDDANMVLSQNRAEAVVNYLEKNGISKSRLSAKGFGETTPEATNETDEGRQLNRRVEFMIK